MTPIILLDELKKFIEENTKDIILSVQDKNGELLDYAPKVYVMRKPSDDDGLENIPYIILQFMEGKDKHKSNKNSVWKSTERKSAGYPDSKCKVCITVAVHSQDGGESELDVLNIITRIRSALLKSGEIGNQFLLRKPLKYSVSSDSTAPYCTGEILTNWELPVIERELYGGE